MLRPCRRPMKSRRSEPARSRFPTLPGTARASALGWEQAWATEWARVLVMEWRSGLRYGLGRGLDERLRALGWVFRLVHGIAYGADDEQRYYEPEPPFLVKFLFHSILPFDCHFTI